MSDVADLLERFRRGPELLAVVTTGAAGPELDFAAEGKWSVRQIVCHLSDSEIVGADRFRRTIAENNPTLLGYDQEAWAANLDYGRRKFSHAVEMFRRVRAETYEILKELPEAAWSRKATHNERGELSLLDLLGIYAGHAESHCKQIQAMRAEYKQSKK